MIWGWFCSDIRGDLEAMEWAMGFGVESVTGEDAVRYRRHRLSDYMNLELIACERNVMKIFDQNKVSQNLDVEL